MSANGPREPLSRDHISFPHGTPQSSLTDNGFVFTTKHRGGVNGFEASPPAGALANR